MPRSTKHHVGMNVSNFIACFADSIAHIYILALTYTWSFSKWLELVPRRPVHQPRLRGHGEALPELDGALGRLRVGRVDVHRLGVERMRVAAEHAEAEGVRRG